MSECILVFPHIGTALGHFVRTMEYLNTYYQHSDAPIYVVLPENLVQKLDAHIPSWINRKNIIRRKHRVSINNPEGRLLIEQFKQYFVEDEMIHQQINPSLLITDPGIQGAILHHKFNTPWINITHGVYRPLPFNISDELKPLAEEVWRYLNQAFNQLIQLGIGSPYGNWNELRHTAIREELLQKKMQKCGWKVSNRPYNVLVTCCSADEVCPPSDFLSNLKQRYSDIAVAGISIGKAKRQGMVSNVTYVGNEIRYDSLIDSHSMVITHGGFGTLQMVSQANRIIIIPSDLDQLCNAIIFCSDPSYREKSELLFGRDWHYSLHNNPFRRFVEWDNIRIE